MELKANWYLLSLALLCSSFFSAVGQLAGGNREESSICNVKASNTVEVDRDIWSYEEPAAEDALDKYLVNKTGRQYWAGKFAGWLDLPEVCFEGAVYEWRWAVRAQDYAVIMLSWTGNEGYSFFIGELDNARTNMFDRSRWQKLWELSTPGILSTERYVPFYLRLEPGSLTFGTECDRRLAFTHNTTVARGDRVRLAFQTFSRYGGKLLYTPPLSNSGVTFSSICKVTVPSTVEVTDSVWKHTETPIEDALDIYLVDKTGCQYWAGQCREEFRPPAASFDGVAYEWRGAIRSKYTMLITVEWGLEGAGYTFHLDNYTSIAEAYTGYYTSNGGASKGLMSSDRYAGLYVRLEPGSLLLKTECDERLVTTLNATVALGDRVQMTFSPISFYGGKFLHSCPKEEDPACP